LPASPPLPGAADALRACARTGALIAIATARPTPASVVARELAEVGLGQLVDVVVTTESVGGPAEPIDADSPVLEGYLTKKRQIESALRELGVPAERAAIVSDEAFDLVEGAELGVPRLVGVLGGNSDHDAFDGTGARVLDSVADLPQALGVTGWPLRLGAAVSRGSLSP
jgi:phosphoglycolate phosphatase-like HAD superfamily hydrolase